MNSQIDINQRPFITVFTPNYNKAEYLPETIESVLNQTYSNFEYIIIDDCSSDESWKIINRYAKQDDRIKAFKNEKNLKIVKNRNKGFKLSSPKAKYFAIIDSDDVALPDRLETQVTFLENNLDYGLVGSNLTIIDQNSHEIGKREYVLSDTEIRKIITRLNPFAQSSVVLRKEVINEIGLYDEQWNVCQDYDYWLRVGMGWKLQNLKMPLIKYRLSNTQVKRTHLKDTIQNTLSIQKKAIKEYGYDDNLKNKFYRFFMRASLVYPKIAYMFYRKFILN